MEQIYRRRSSHISSQTSAAKARGTYKQTLVRQSVFCLILFIGFLCLKVTPNPALEPARRSIELIASTTTDFKSIPEKISNWVHSALPKEEETPKSSDLLTHLVNPVEAPITSPFGLRSDPDKGEEAFHYGIDLGAAEGEKIKCAADGEATEAGESPEYGNYVVIRHSDTVYTLYAHCTQVLPQPGDAVKAGQVIATVGSTGNATGPHLHFEIRDGETWLNPTDFLDFGQEAAAND